MKFAAAALLLICGSARATSLSSTDHACSLIAKFELAFVGSVTGRIVAVEEVIRGPVREPGHFYNIDNPHSLQYGGRYLLLAARRLNSLSIQHAWDMASLDKSALTALRRVGTGTTLVGVVRFQDGRPAGGLVPVHAVGPGGKRFQTLTQSNGWFSFPEIPAGEYRLSLGDAALNDPSAPLLLEEQSTHVPEQGCSIRSVVALPNSWIAGGGGIFPALRFRMPG